MTKLLFCHLCGEIIQMQNKCAQCRCMNVAGFYLNNDSDIVVYAKEPNYVRVIAISTQFLLEKCAHNFFDLPYLRGTYFDKDKSHIVMYELDSKRAKGSGVITVPTMEKLYEMRISEMINAV